ncbi:MAG: hypothetical protein COA78_26050 [Blastopirellula sp.]|nr:MAG: hypothetical protein COA78_26050 [Blastopirellula sp.]
MICSFCHSDVPDGAIKCKFCSEFLVGQTCTQCLSTIPEEATACRYCGHRINKRKLETNISLEIKADVFASLVFRGRLLPHEIVSDNEKIVIKSPGLFRLWENADEIPWNKVAGFTYRSGIVWDKVEIETRGQKPSVIIGLVKADGEKLREILQNLEK